MKITQKNQHGMPEVGECDDCGADVFLIGPDCECDCGAIYNCFGQRLAPREQWGDDDERE